MSLNTRSHCGVVTESAGPGRAEATGKYHDAAMREVRPSQDQMAAGGTLALKSAAAPPPEALLLGEIADEAGHDRQDHERGGPKASR